MAGSDRREDLDDFIDIELDDDFSEDVTEKPAHRQERAHPNFASSTRDRSNSDADVSLNDAVESLFTSGFHDAGSSTAVTSGDAETDRAIDLAVDTLFVEEPETDAPETAEVEATAVEDRVLEREPSVSPPPRHEPAEEELGDRPVTGPEASVNRGGPSTGAAYDAGTDRRRPEAGAGVAQSTALDGSLETAALRKLQEAILTLEWEISRRSVTALATELQKVRSRFRDDVTVDFAALSMRVVLDYLVKRMAQAHPESIRFLLEITGFLRGNAAATKQDPLSAFHQILTRYERYKSVVRKAEGIPEGKSSAHDDLRIKDPLSFSKLVKSQADTLAMAGQSLAGRIGSTEQPENLIRSFRFLVARSFNRILDNTKAQKAPKTTRKKRTTRR